MQAYINLQKEFPKEYKNVSVSFNAVTESFKGYMYTQAGTGFVFFIKENGNYWTPKSNHYTYWKYID